MLLSANPKANYQAHREDLEKAIKRVMDSGLYILGPSVKKFEKHFSEYLGVSSCVGMASGSDALQFALRACGIKAGDDVITVSHTAVATVSAIHWLGARPILVDINEDDYTIDPQKVEDTLARDHKGNIRAIVAVHLYGHPADTDSLGAIATRYGIRLIEDCAQSHGAMIGIQKTGSMGDCGAFSFYPTKNLGAFGDAGAVTSNEPTVTEQLRLLQQYGWRERYISDIPGYNSRLDELQAAILDCKLSWLNSDNDQRRRIARRYSAALSELDIELPIERSGNLHVYHQYVIRVQERDHLRGYLAEKGIGSGILYPIPVHKQPGYANLVELGAGGLSVTERIADRILCLPIYPELDDKDVERVIEGIKSYFV